MRNKQFAAFFRIMTIVLIVGSTLLQRSGVISELMQYLVTGVSLCMLGVLMVIENRHSKKTNAKIDIVVGLVLVALGLYLIVQLTALQMAMA